MDVYVLKLKYTDWSRKGFEKVFDNYDKAKTYGINKLVEMKQWYDDLPIGYILESRALEEFTIAYDENCMGYWFGSLSVHNKQLDYYRPILEIDILTHELE